MTRFQKWTQILVLYTLLVILWGAWVRISHSGDGCGDTWPLCHGQIIPDAEQKKTWVEFAHRIMSGLYGFFILGLFFSARRIFPSEHPVRRWAFWSLVFMITEALLGAKLVLFKLVTNNDTPFRAFAMGLHLVNSVMLTGSLTLTADFAGQRKWQRKLQSPWTIERLKPRRIAGGMVLSFLLIGVSGGIAALAATLFPAHSLAEGLRADWDSGSHYLVRLRGLHPLFGLLFGGSLFLTAWLSTQLLKPEEVQLRRRSLRLATALGLGIGLGLMTLLLFSPVPLKLLHLLLGHCIWIFLVLWIREVFYKPS